MKKYITALVLALSIHTQAFAQDEKASDITIDVKGLVCDFCAQALQKVFSKNDAVEKIDVDLDNQKISVWLNEGLSINDETLNKLVTDAGYNSVAIHRTEQ